MRQFTRSLTLAAAVALVAGPTPAFAGMSGVALVDIVDKISEKITRHRKGAMIQTEMDSLLSVDSQLDAASGEGSKLSAQVAAAFGFFPDDQQLGERYLSRGRELSARSAALKSKLAAAAVNEELDEAALQSLRAEGKILRLDACIYRSLPMAVARIDAKNDSKNDAMRGGLTVAMAVIANHNDFDLARDVKLHAETL